MSEPNDPLDARIRRLVGDAVSDSPSPPSTEEMMSVNRPTDQRPDSKRRWIAGGTIGLVAAAVITLLVVPIGDDDVVQPVDTAPTIPIPGTGTTVATADTEPSTATTEPDTTEPPSTTAPATAASTTAPPTTTAPSSTSTSTATTAPTTAPSPDPEATQNAIDLIDASVFGLSYGTEADPGQVIDDLEPALGVPSSDTEWQPTPPGFDPGFAPCFGPRFRTVWWGDFRLTFEETADGDVRLAAWSVGDPMVDRSAPLGDLPVDRSPSGVAADGAGVGSSRADVLSVVPGDRMIGDTPEGVIVTGAIVTTFSIDATDTVTAIGSGRLDCTAGAD